MSYVVHYLFQIEHGGVLKDGVRDVYWFQLNSLHALSDLHGENSTETIEAKQLLNEAILKLNSAFNKAYKGNVLVNIITSDASHTRRSRSILQADVGVATKDDVSKFFYLKKLWFHLRDSSRL